ncbi:MAG: HAD hydrolase family [Beijerinckiaceae bacterium]|nr:MAG: HAD hydrolase family [Beijerinckiaceae bacterium]
MAAKLAPDSWIVGKTYGIRSHLEQQECALLLDLDGTLIRGGQAIPGAVEFVSRHHSRIAIVTNNSSDTPASMAARLGEMGLNIPSDLIFLAGVSAAEHIAREHPGKTVMILGSPELKAFASSLGLELSDHRPEIVLVGRDESFNYAKLATAGNAVAAGAKFYASNSDVFHPGPVCLRVPETGSLTVAIMALAGRSPDRVYGKPDAHMLVRALERLQRPRASAIMIGDNPTTDGQAARNANIRFIEVGDHVGRSIADVGVWLEKSL